MAHIDLEHFEMKPAPVVRFEITRHRREVQVMLYVSALATFAIIGVAMLFLTMRG